jgi:hypothetical protein
MLTQLIDEAVDGPEWDALSIETSTMKDGDASRPLSEPSTELLDEGSLADTRLAVHEDRRWLP